MCHYLFMFGIMAFLCISFMLGNAMLQIDCIQNIELGAFSKFVCFVTVIASMIALINNIYQTDYISCLRYSDVVNLRVNVLIKSMLILSAVLIFMSGWLEFMYIEMVTTTDLFKLMRQPVIMSMLISLVFINNPRMG